MYHTTQVLISPSMHQDTRLPVCNTSPVPSLREQQQQQQLQSCQMQEKQIQQSNHCNSQCSGQHCDFDQCSYIEKDDDSNSVNNNNNNNENNSYRCQNEQFTYELQFCLQKDLQLRSADKVQNSTSNRTTEKAIQRPSAKCKQTKQKLAELVHYQHVIRSEIVQDAKYMLQALATWCKESNPTTCKVQQRATKLRLLQLKLQSRMSKWDYAARENEQRLLNDGRRAWQKQIAMQTAAMQVERQRCEWRRQETMLFSRAVTFIIVSHNKEYHAICTDQQKEWNALQEAQAHAKKQAQHQAWVNFMNSPEQRALAAQKERLEVLKRKKEARQARLHKIQQEKFIHNCHHGRNGQSLFTGPAPQKMCGKCQVRYDEEKKCYVSMLNVSKTSKTKLGKSSNVIKIVAKAAKK